MGGSRDAQAVTPTQSSVAWDDYHSLENELYRHKLALADAVRELESIHTSNGWKLLRATYGVARRFLPDRSRRLRAARKAVRAAMKCLSFLRKIPARKRPAGPPPTAPLPSAEPSVAVDLAALPPSVSDDPAYAHWIRQNEPTGPDLMLQWRTRFARRPLISIAVPTFNSPAPFLRAMLDSVLAQTYSNWELCIADGSTDPKVAELLRDYAEGDLRIKINILGRNEGIAGNSNAAIALATGDYVALLDHDDALAPFALFEMVRAINDQPDADLIYSDEDKLSPDGAVRYEPIFKPDWSPDTLRSYNYICHLSLFRRELLTELGGFRAGFDGSQDYDLVLRATDRTERIVHIPKVLYHWRTHSASTAYDPKAKTYAFESARKALAEHLQRRGTPGTVEFGPIDTYSIRYHLPTKPLVSIIIPNRDQSDVLRTCIKSIDRSSYKNVELVILENGSKEAATHAYYDELARRPNVRLLTWDQPFNYSAINNFAVRHSAGEVLLFLNNDIEALNGDWMERMLGHVLSPKVGAVGAKLFYPDDTIQHAGVVVGLGGVAGHVHYHYPRDVGGYVARLVVAQNFSAVTGACLMCRREALESVGGFDERFVIAFNDIDFCLKLREKGWLIVWTPEARLYHYESKTRGPDTEGEALLRFQREVYLFQECWKEFLRRGDPYYSPNLTLQTCDFAIRA
jgi:GT2 family glycosyltransferase